MARRRTKKRTHVGARNGAAKVPTNKASLNQSPKSMVIRIGAGEVGPSVSQLVKDVRSMMEPGTASKLKVSVSFGGIPAHAPVYTNANLRCAVGKKVQQTQRLYDYGWPPWSITSTSVL